MDTNLGSFYLGNIQNLHTHTYTKAWTWITEAGFTWGNAHQYNHTYTKSLDMDDN